MELLTFRLAENNGHDGLAFCGLYNSLYAKKVDLAYYKWQFFDTPFPSLLSVATVGERPIGFYGLHILSESLHDAPIAWVLDIMIHPDYQDKGIFRRLAGFAKFQLNSYEPKGIFVMANQNGANAHIGGLGWNQINVLRSFVAAPSVAARIAGGALAFEEVSDLSEMPEGAFRRGAAGPKPMIGVKRDTAYLHWRFALNPRFRYKQFRVLNRSILFGYLVLKTFEDPKTSEVYGDIVDLGWVHDAPDLIVEMLRFALRSLFQQGAGLALMWLQTNTLLDGLGRDVGFREIDQKRYFCGEIIDQNYEFLVRPESWFTTLSDSEIY